MGAICILILFVLVVLFFCFPAVRICLLSPFLSVFYAFKDAFFYLWHREYNYYHGGELTCYFAHFGGGKTLSAVKRVRYLFNRYNNKMVWDMKKKKYVLQKVHILSNVALLDVPYEPLKNMAQFVRYAEVNKVLDRRRNTHTCLLVLLDEASVQLNSRSFRENFSPDTINAILTSRHFSASLFLTSQKFKLYDALMRSVTQKAVWCRKCWRFMVQYTYSADELELASDARLVKPLYTGGFFIRDKDYRAYDTLATVENLTKTALRGDMLSDREILELRATINPDNDAISRPSKLLRRMRNGGRKRGK